MSSILAVRRFWRAIWNGTNIPTSEEGSHGGIWNGIEEIMTCASNVAWQRMRYPGSAKALDTILGGAST